MSSTEQTEKNAVEIMILFNCWDTYFHSDYGVLQLDMLAEPSVGYKDRGKNRRRVPHLVSYRNLGLDIILKPIRRISEGEGEGWGTRVGGDSKYLIRI